MENQINRILAGQLSVLEDEELEKELELIMKDIEIPTTANIPENIPKISEKLPKISEKLPNFSEKIPIISEKVPIISENIPLVSEKIPIISEKMDFNESISDDILLQELNEIVDISTDISIDMNFPEVPTSFVLPTPPNDDLLIKKKEKKEIKERKLVSS